MTAPQMVSEYRSRSASGLRELLSCFYPIRMFGTFLCPKDEDNHVFVRANREMVVGYSYALLHI